MQRSCRHRLLPPETPFCYHLHDQNDVGTLQCKGDSVSVSTKWKSQRKCMHTVCLYWHKTAVGQCILKPSHSPASHEVSERDNSQYLWIPAICHTESYRGKIRQVLPPAAVVCAHCPCSFILPPFGPDAVCIQPSDCVLNKAQVPLAMALLQW